MIELELILPMSVAVAPDIEVCLDLRSSAQLQMHQCFPVTLDTSNANQLRSPLKTAVTLEIEDSSLFQVEAYIKGCATKNQHCRSSVQVKTCRTSIFGVIGGGAACKSSWNSQNDHFAAPLVDSSSLSSRQHATSSSYTSCTHMDSINRCVFPSGALCFDEQSHQWHVKRNSLDTKTYNIALRDPTSFLNIFLGPSRRRIEEAVATIISNIPMGKKEIAHHKIDVIPVVPYMRHVFFHAVADNAFHLFASLLDTDKKKKMLRSEKVLVLAGESYKYDFLLEHIVGKKNLLYLGELMATQQKTSSGERPLHCFENVLTGIKRGDGDSMTKKDLNFASRHRFDVWSKLTMSTFRSHMLVASKVLALSGNERPHLTVLVHRARSEAQSLPGEFITTDIRQIINRDQLWQTVQDEVTSAATCVDQRASQGTLAGADAGVQVNSRNAVHAVMEDLSFSAQLEMMMRTEVFLHMHGSAGVLSFFLSPGTTFIELRPYNFTWTTWALEIAKKNGLREVQWRNDNQTSSFFAIHPYTTHFDHKVLKYFQQVDKCDDKELERMTGGIRGLSTWCEQYFRDQHTMVDVNAIGVLLREALRVGLYCSGSL